MTLKVFVSGQSNSLGRNTGGPDWSTISADVRVWNNVNPLGANGSAFTTAALARAGGTFENLDRNNFAVWFCHRLANETGDTVDMTIVSRGASQIELWDPAEVTFPMLDECIDVWTATGQGPADIFLWHQGEGNVGDDYATYSAKFFALLSNLEAGGVIDSNTVVIVGELSNTGADDKVVFNNEVLRLIGESAPRRACALSTLLPTDDGTHFTGDALYWFGYDRYYKAYLAALYDPMYALVNDGGTPGVASSGDNSIVDFNVVRGSIAKSSTALQPGDGVEWTWLANIPANIDDWADLAPNDLGFGANTELTNWDSVFGAKARWLGYSSGTGGTGQPADVSMVGWYVPRGNTQGAQFAARVGTSSSQLWFRGGGVSTWGPWRELLHDGNYPPTAGYRQKGAPIFITASGTYTPSAGTVAIMVEVIGGGGGGGGAIGNDGTSRCSSGGAAGGYARSFITSLAGSYSVTIGAAGTAGAADVAGAAGSGGTTSFGSISATGGVGGSASSTTATAVAVTSSNGGAGSGGDFNLQGEGGEGSLKVSNDARLSGAGGSTKYGTGGRQRGASSAGTGTAGVDASGYGAGGGGATSSNTVGQAGGAGAPGVVVVTEYVR